MKVQGKRYGRLIYRASARTQTDYGHWYVDAICDCGKMRQLTSSTISPQDERNHAGAYKTRTAQRTVQSYTWTWETWRSMKCSLWSENAIATRINTIKASGGFRIGMG